MTPEEWILLKAGFKKDAEEAFEILYTRLWEKLYSVSYNYVRDKATAQEIVQDVFVALWLKRDRMEGVQDIGAFAMRAVQNRIYDYFDKKAVEDRYVLRVSKSAAPPINTTQHEVEYNETFKIIHREIDGLPATTKKVFRLSRFERFTNEEIAKKLQLSVKSVEYHITQALKQLRLKMRYTGLLLVLLIGLS